MSFISDGKTAFVLFVALLPTFGGVGGVIAEIGGVRSASFASLANADNGEGETFLDPTLSSLPLIFFCCSC